ncbi:MAG: deoxyribonuclease IV [Acidobacteria bacterium]|nr:deoxyribonuclease IV [Acidobacteriota bacterium]
MRRIGIHTSTAGSLDRAAAKAAELGANTFQIFSASPRMWRAPAPDPAAIERLREVRERHDLAPLVIHDNYLINLASSDEVIRRKSIDGFRGELERAIAIGAEYLVAHPGNYKGSTIEQGIQTLAGSLEEAARGIRGRKLTLLLENTAGSGAQLGSKFEELAAIRESASKRVPFEIGYCIDTCHSLVAGYDVATAAGLRATIAEMKQWLGLDLVRVIHTNDSKKGLGSRVDRHENIGEGCIGEEGFRRILNHPALRDKPFILETPVDNEGDDRKNVEALKRLCRRSRTTTTKSN